MRRDQVRNIRILGPVILLQRRADRTLQHSVPDARQIDSIRQPTGLRFLVSGAAHPAFPIDVAPGVVGIIGIISVRGCGAGSIAGRIISP